MAGIEYKKRKVTEATTEVPRNQDFRRRFVGDIGELMNNMCDLLEMEPFELKGSSPQHALLGAFIQSAMKHGSLEIVVGDEIIELDISEKKLGNLTGLLALTRAWKMSAGRADASDQNQGIEKAEVGVPDASEQASPSDLPSISEEEQATLSSYVDAVDSAELADSVPAPADTVQEESGAAYEDDEGEGDAKNQLYMPLDDEAKEPASAPVETTSAGESESDSQPERAKRAIPDFRAQMRKGEK